MTDMTPRLSTALADRYTLERELGHGGMATVYLAHDLRHDRKVAIKVLRPELAAVLGAERFVQEIKTTANLQHPNILPLFDSGEADDFLYYVMPYVAGETLRDKLNRETQLGIEEAVKITTDVADALDYAHDHGVIHRDIKPENILLHAGRPLVADFGIALAVSAAAGGRMTETGLSLGTPHYMSPEQATADKHVTHRSDIYSLGAVLYEMLTGDPPHTGSSAQQIIMRIVTEEARPITELRKSVPAQVAAVVAKALEKLPADRFASAKAFAEALANPAAAGPTASVDSGVDRGRARAGLPAIERLAWAAATVVALALSVFVWTARRATDRRATVAVNRLELALPEAHPVVFAGPLGLASTSLTISRDGRRIVYVGREGDGRRLFLYELASFHPTGLAGTDSAYAPFFSWDGREVGFFVGNRLKKIHLEGGRPVDLAEVDNASAGVWGPHDTIFYVGDVGFGLYRVSSAGGDAAAVASVNPGGPLFSWPRLLPGGDRLLHVGWFQDLWVLNLATLKDTRIEAAGGDARHLPTGHLLVTRGEDAYTVPFDFDRLARLGGETPAIAGVRTEFHGAAQLDVSEAGTLVYLPGHSAAEGTLVVAGPDGSVEPVGGVAAARFGPFQLAPDRRRLATEVWTATAQIVIYDLERDDEYVLTREGNSGNPIWSPTGDRIAFWSERSGAHLPFVRSADATGSAEAVNGPWREAVPTAWSVGGFLALDVNSDETSWDVVAIGMDARDSVVPVATTKFLEWGSSFSPDGRWIAYTSNEVGYYQIYVQPFPPTGARHRVTFADPAEEPLWSRDGRELYYRSGTRWLAVPISTYPSFGVGKPRLVLEADFSNLSWRSYDFAPDDRRLLVVQGIAGAEARTLRLIQGWFDVLKSSDPPRP